MTLEIQNDIQTGEENEDAIYCQRSKLLRFRDGEWKERGIGEARILKHKETGQCRFIFRQEKTNYLRANHCILEDSAFYKLEHNKANRKVWQWMAQDYADDLMQ